MPNMKFQVYVHVYQKEQPWFKLYIEITFEKNNLS